MLNFRCTSPTAESIAVSAAASEAPPLGDAWFGLRISEATLTRHWASG